MRRVTVAMSGGVDSSVAAFVLCRGGDDCVGATMKLFDNGDVGIPRDQACCSLDDVEDARAVCRRLGIDHFVFNFSDAFRRDVIGRFVSAYERGRTPNPCVDCNRYVKFDAFYRRSRELGREYIATGHYARTEFDEASGRWLLRRPVDRNKDQTYVLYSMTQDQLAHTVFPLGELTKPEVRAIAEREGFINAKKRDSQDICFVPDGRYAEFIESYTGKEYPPGDFIDADGAVIGRHGGVIRYTIGQRRGLGVSFCRPMYVAAVNTADNTVTLTPESGLYGSSLSAHGVNLISRETLESPVRVTAKIRYSHRECGAVAVMTDADALRVDFDEPQRAITSGQAVVLYDGDVVVGGATID